ncbi:MAG TPA: hypothetical protein VIU33_06190 [Nitrospiria bacterium]
MWTRWFPWRWMIRRLARSHGFLDPVAIQSRLHRFAQPSEVAEPIELLRAGMILHARGLINTRAIQHNLDWVWPYWVECQFNPEDPAFIPRAFTITHVNLTHRNWTAIGTPAPDGKELPIVDPRGLLTPFWDGWSLDAWMLSRDGRFLIPSRNGETAQTLLFNDRLAVRTLASLDDLRLTSRIEVRIQGDVPVCRMTLKGETDTPAWLILSARPYNPEGVSFIHDIKRLPENAGWNINGEREVHFDFPPELHAFSIYRDGDVSHKLPRSDSAKGVHCSTGLATAAALYELSAGETRTIHAEVPFPETPLKAPRTRQSAAARWPGALRNACRLDIPDEHVRFLFDAAVHSLVLHSREDIYPGPFTYKRFWFRDAAFILNALLSAGLVDRVEEHLDRFPERQTRGGYFRSQEGEWDSNGEAVWTYQRFAALSGRPLRRAWLDSVERGGEWIIQKRTTEQSGSPHAGLLPAGFSAEHLGPNDFYYWDDFWSIAGLRAAAELLENDGRGDLPARFRAEADDLMEAVERSLIRTRENRNGPGMPASPYRRMDSGAVGSLAAGYPLRLWPAEDPRLLDTAEFLLNNCFVQGGFFQDMIHSGINPYLTLHIAQVLLRAGDPRFVDLMDAVAAMASPTGQWPEAIHPRTGGGCMGDGHHVWASAEWFLMIRNCFIREEEDRLILGSGIPDRWLQTEKPLSFGPSPTPFGPVSVHLIPEGKTIRLSWEGRWRTKAPTIQVRLPGYPLADAPEESETLTLTAG